MKKYIIETFNKKTGDYISDGGFIDDIKEAQKEFDFLKNDMKHNYTRNKNIFIELNEYTNIVIEKDGEYNFENIEINTIERFELD